MADLRIIPIEELTPGMYVVQITAQNGPVKIRKQGHINSPYMVKGLTEMGVTELQIDVTQSIVLEPEFSAEIDSSHAPSQTQALLQQTQARNLDNEMSEQFNRSIFLPSIQRMPSLWERLRGDIVRYTLVFSVGLTFGYTAMWGYIYPPKAIEIAQPSAVVQAPQAGQASEIEQTPKAQTETSAVQNPTNATTQVADISPLEASTDLLSTPSRTALKPEVFTEESNIPSESEAEGRLLTGATEDSGIPSPEIQARLAEALAELDDLPAPDPATQVKVTSSDDLPRIGQLPASLLTQMPSMVFAQHMYSSEADARWVRVNNRRLQEGDMIEGRVKIEAIEPQHVVLSLNGTRFTMAALTDW
jgi:general secretion pathway protein B